MTKTGNKNSKVWFDMCVLSLFKAYNSNLDDDFGHMGTFCIDRDKLKEISVDEICNYIVKNPTEFFIKSKCASITKNSSYRFLKIPYLCVRYIHYKDDNAVECNVFINNVREI